MALASFKSPLKKENEIGFYVALVFVVSLLKKN